MVETRKLSVPPVPPVGEGKRGVDGYLSYLLRQAATMVRSAMDRRLADQGITFPQYTSLVMINAYPGLSSADLARVTMLTPPTVNELVRTLERSRLIERRPHSTHRKILCLHITEAGATRMRTARGQTQEIDALLNEGMEGEAGEKLRRWLTRVAVELSGGAQ